MSMRCNLAGAMLQSPENNINDLVCYLYIWSNLVYCYILYFQDGERATESVKDYS